MTAPVPCGAPQTDPRVLPGHQGDDQHREGSALHPDVLAYADQLVGPVTPYRLRYLQRQYDRGLMGREAREAETPVLVMSRRCGSVPVDRAVGERVTNKMRRIA